MTKISKRQMIQETEQMVVTKAPLYVQTRHFVL